MLATHGAPWYAEVLGKLLDTNAVLLHSGHHHQQGICCIPQHSLKNLGYVFSTEPHKIMLEPLPPRPSHPGHAQTAGSKQALATPGGSSNLDHNPSQPGSAGGAIRVMGTA